MLCVLLLTTCAGTVSSDKSQGKTVQQLGDDPPCGTPVECYAQAIEALKEAEQKIEGLKRGLQILNETVYQAITNQSQVNKQLNANQTQLKTNVEASIEEVKTNQTKLNASIEAVDTKLEAVKANTSTNTKAISANTKAIATNKDIIANNSKKLSSLSISTCNCVFTGSSICKSGVPNGGGKCCQYCLSTKTGDLYVLPQPLVRLLPHSLTKRRARKTRKTNRRQNLN